MLSFDSIHVSLSSLAPNKTKKALSSLFLPTVSNVPMSSNTDKRKNILVVMADQLTALALGCYGHPVVKSPNIDRLAEEGVVFDACYSSSPLCTPARYAFMTGQYCSRSGGYDNAAYMPSTMPTFAHYLRLQGYRTCLSGKMHFVGPDQLHGFEERLTTDVYPADFGWIPDWTNPDERIDLWYHNMSSIKQAGVAAITNQLTYDDEVGNAAVRAIYEHARGTDERPMALVTSFIHPHDPYATRQKYWDLYADDEIDLPRVPRPATSENDPHSLRLEKPLHWMLSTSTMMMYEMRVAPTTAIFPTLTSGWVGCVTRWKNAACSMTQLFYLHPITAICSVSVAFGIKCRLTIGQIVFR